MNMPTMSEIKLNFLKDMKKLVKRGNRNHQLNENAHLADDKKDPSREQMSERMFVRAFGSKVAKVRYSNRADFVGLMIMGKSIGFMVVRDKDGRRKLRVLENNPVNGALIMTKRYRLLKSEDSLSNLQRGLLNWVQ